jgi:predicted kinase
VGLPASGKSHFAKEIAEKENAIIHASDTLRKELFGDEEVNDKNEELFKELHKRIKYDLQSGKNVIYDATNIHYKRRKAFLGELKKIDCEKICYLVATPYEKCLDQNRQRGRVVPEYVIKKMYLNFYIPQYYEGWDKIIIIKNDEGYKVDLSKLFLGENGLNNIPQDNPNHDFTIGWHCVYTHRICKQLTRNMEVYLAATYHDIGKKFTKAFRNAKGEPTDIAHYYQHHLVSAYESLFYLREYGLDSDDTILNIANYIQWHMQPHLCKSEKEKEKFIRLVGQEFYDNLLILNEADKRASKKSPNNFMDKRNDEFIEFCNECDWEEETIGLPYHFCPKCGHVNIGFTRNDIAIK